MIENKATDTTSEALDLIWGVSAIAKAIGRTYRATYHMLTEGRIPGARHLGERWVVSRKKLVAFFDGADDEGA